MSDMDASAVNAELNASKRRVPRKAVAKLPLAQAHALDVAKAAKLGVDISFMVPGERCQYPSKFCCNIRARKSTGKLHRFCEDHRVRAKLNQKRWVEARRNANQDLATALALCRQDALADLDWVDEALGSTLSELNWAAIGSSNDEASADPNFDEDEICFLLSTILGDSPDWESEDSAFSTNPGLLMETESSGMFNL